MTLEQSPNIGADCLTIQVSFNFGSIASPADFITQFQEDLFQNVPIASPASSVDVSPCWSELGLHYPDNTNTAISSSVASPNWSEVGHTYQANVDASTTAIQHTFRPTEDTLPPPSPLLYHDVPAPPASILFDALLTVAHNKLHDLQYQLLNLLTNVATHTSDFNVLIADLPFIEEVENIPLSISAVLPACSPLPEYVIRSPTPPLRYPSPVAAAAIQPPPTDNNYLVDYSLFPHLFAKPPCMEVADTHPHLYTVVYEHGEKIWCPQDEYIHHNPLGIIPRVQDLDQVSPFFVTPFCALTYHKVHIHSNHTLPSITICAKVGHHPSSLHFPFGYLESSFVDSLKFLFGQFPPAWLTYFKGALVLVIAYDFLNGHLATLIGCLHFTDQGLFIIERQVRTEDLLCTQPSLFAFVPTPRTPAKPLTYVTPPDDDKPL